MLEHFLTILREKQTSFEEFRKAAAGISRLLAANTAEYLPLKPIKIETPLKVTQGSRLEESIVLIAILRSGLALLGSFQELFSQASIGFLGIRRDESTAKPHLYYENLPKLSNQTRVIVLDPMLATAGTIELALKKIEEAGASLDRTLFVSIIASQEGADHLKRKFPSVKLITAAIDPHLDSQKFIVPGLGDFGDRYFNT